MCSLRLSGCLIMVFQASGPGHVETYRDFSTHKMQDSVSVSVHMYIQAIGQFESDLLILAVFFSFRLESRLTYYSRSTVLASKPLDAR